MKNIYYTAFSFFVILFISCQPDNSFIGNPPAPGFNMEDSDAEAIAIADKVMEAMGGRQNWENTQYLKWNFFGSRRHVWNKKTNDVVIEGLRKNYKIKMNLDNMEGEVVSNANTLTKADSLDKYLQMGKEAWINDAYWLVMPYKLKDSGVTLKYKGKDTTENGIVADKLELTFADVGVTPDNKYEVYIDPSSNLLVQWDFYRRYEDTIPRFTTPWGNWKQMDSIMLSGDRGGARQITEVAVGDTLARYFK